jgi:hypothetical protein
LHLEKEERKNEKDKDEIYLILSYLINVKKKRGKY